MSYKRGRWAMHWKHCRECKTTQVKHNAYGLCMNCYQRHQYRSKAA